MKLSLDKSTKDLLVNLVFSLIVAVCCVVAYAKFFVPNLPKIYVIDVAKMETDIRRELIALAYNNNGIPIDADFIAAEIDKLIQFIEKVGQQNKALIFNKSNLIADGIGVKDITQQVFKMYADSLKDKK